MHAKFFVKRHSSNCGVEFYDFEPRWDGVFEGFSIAGIAKSLGKYERIRSLVAFSGNGYQRRKPWGAHAFAAWLKKQKEEVFASPVLKNTNTQNNIQAYFWAPSRDFKKKIRAEQAKLVGSISYNPYY